MIKNDFLGRQTPSFLIENKLDFLENIEDDNFFNTFYYFVFGYITAIDDITPLSDGRINGFLDRLEEINDKRFKR